MSGAAFLRSGSLAAVFLSAGLSLSPATAAAAGAAPAGRTAAILFLSSYMMPFPPCDLAQVHEGAWDALTSAAGSPGAEVVSRSAMEPVVRDWRVRNSQAVSMGFLDSLAVGFACGQILVVDVTILPDRLLVIGRVTITADKETIWAGAAEEKLPRNLADGKEPASGPWIGAIDHACRRLLEQRMEDRGPGPVAASDLYLLPVRQAGLDELVADLVSECLLRSLIGRQWRIQDPGVTFSRLRDAGIDPRSLDRRVRPALTGGAPAVLVVGDVATYEDVGSASTPLNEDLPSLARPLLPSFSVSARWIDGRSGEVTFASTLYVGDEQAPGLFGAPRNPSPIRRVQRATDQLVHAAHEKG